MRFLVVPSYEFSANVLADSSFTLTRRILDALPDGTHSLFVVPKLGDKGHRRYEAHGELPTSPRYSLIPIPMFSGKVACELGLPDALLDMFNPVAGRRVDYDAIFTTNASLAGRLAQMGSMPRGAVTRPPVVYYDYGTPFIGTDCDLAYLKSGPVDRVLPFYEGLAASDLCVFFNDWTRMKAQSQFRKIFSSALCRDFDRKAKVIPLMFADGKLQTAIADVTRRKELTVYWGGRLTGTKNVTLAAEVVDYMYSFGHKVEMVITTAGTWVDKGKLRVGECAKFPSQIELHKGLPQEDAWRIMASCHISVFPQSLRFGPAAPMEQLSAGLIVLINKKDSTSVLPKDYPWYWDGEAELHALLRHVVRNYEEERQKLPKWQLYARSLALDANIGRLHDEVSALVARNDAVTRRVKNQLFAGRAAEAVAGQSWLQYSDDLLANHVIFKMLKHMLYPNIKTPAMWPVYQHLRVAGRIDDTLPVPVIK